MLPTELLDEWKEFVVSLSNMIPFNVERNLHFANAICIELIGYCDASIQAYGAVLYIRAIFPDRAFVNILCSKSRLVPLNNILT